MKHKPILYLAVPKDDFLLYDQANESMTHEQISNLSGIISLDSREKYLPSNADHSQALGAPHWLFAINGGNGRCSIMPPDGDTKLMFRIDADAQLKSTLMVSE